MDRSQELGLQWCAALVTLLVMGVVVVTYHTNFHGTRNVIDRIGHEIVSLLQNASPLPQTVVVCSKFKHDGRYGLRTSYGEEYLLKPELRLRGTRTTDKKAFQQLIIGRTYYVNMRKVPFVEWNREINSLSPRNEFVRIKPCES